MIVLHNNLHLDQDIYSFSNNKLTYILSLQVDGEVTTCNMLNNAVLAFGTADKGGKIWLFYELQDFSVCH
jgi:hypothetical protein